MNLAFPLCREPRHEERVRDALEQCVAYLRQQLDPADLVAIVLTGSFARGEGTVLPREGRLRVLGDFEFFVVLRRQAAASATHRQLHVLARTASGLLAGRGVRAEVEFGPVDPAFFAERARPSIFVYDLREHGKVLWGPSDVLAAIPAFGPEAIPHEDALQLLFNRTIEQLDTWDRLAALDTEGLLDGAYQRVKLTLDLAGSVLAFAGRHTSLYRRRPDAFVRLVAETPSLHAHLPPDFIDDLAAASRAKLEPLGHFPRPVGPNAVADERERLRREALAAVPTVVAFLHWELEQLLGTRPDLDELLDAYARMPRPGRRLWEWGKLVLNPLPAPLPISHLRAARLGLRSTPRALLYSAGALAYIDLVARRHDPGAIARRLPLPRRAEPRDPAACRRAIVALWRWCVRNS